MGSKRKNMFLVGVSAVYLIAFTSLYVQIPGLYGDSGLMPAKNEIKSEPQGLQDFLSQPTLLRYKAKYALDSESAMDLLTLFGIILSFLATVSSEMRTSMVFFLLWALYLSLYTVGQVFLGFQWDILLLEAGFIAIMVAPLKLFGMPSKHHHDRVSMFLCIPTPLAWYFHHLPQWFKMMSNAIVFITQIPVSFLFFSPIRNLRMFSFYAQVVLQVLILLTGNYNFFNLLTIILCFSLLDDDDEDAKDAGSGFLARIGSVLSPVISIFVYAVLAFFSVKYFSISVSSGRVNTKINFTRSEFDTFTHSAVGISIWVAIASLCWEIVSTLYNGLVAEKGIIKKVYSFLSTVAISQVVIFLFSLSLTSHTAVDRSVRQQLPPQIFNWYNSLYPLHITNSYGLFRRMTGVGGRSEVVILGSYDAKVWHEYEFLYKPGDINRRPPIVAPHQPRLDWQMWFAALGSHHHNPWLVRMCYLLLNNQPAVTDLIEYNPFEKSGPKYVKALLYTYHYSSINSTSWWVRDPKPKEYIPSWTLNDYVNYFKEQKLYISGNRAMSVSSLDSSLRFIRSLIRGIDHVLMICALLVLAFANIILNNAFPAKRAQPNVVEIRPKQKSRFCTL